MRASRTKAATAVAVALGGLLAAPATAEDAFDLTELSSVGRTVAAELADVNGDGKSDLFQIVYDGVPPNETRQVRVFLQKADGSVAPEPDRVFPLPEGSATYDVGDIDERPGEELILLRARGLGVLSLADGSLRVLAGDTYTAGIAADERGLDRTELLRGRGGDERWLVVPLLGQTLLLKPDGTPVARLDVGARTNYFIAEATGTPIRETGIQVFFDSPKIQLGDVDGDGRTDVISNSRHEVRVFQQRPDGRFPSEPDQRLPLARLSEEDHMRGAGTVSVEVGDLDGDPRADLIVNHTSGGLTSVRTDTTTHLNRDGTWNLEAEDQRFESDGGWSGAWLADLDGDGRDEMIRVKVELGVLELAEFLLQRSFDAEIRVYAARAGGGFEEEPDLDMDRDLPWSLETFRPKGFLLDFQGDLNGDGWRDLLGSNGGESLDVSLGGPDGELRRRVARQDADSRGRVRFGDFDGDALVDLVLYDPTRDDAPVWIARNRGLLPGTRPSVVPAGLDE